MFDNSIVNETSPEANWNRQTGQAGRQAGPQYYVLSQADALTKNGYNTLSNSQPGLKNTLFCFIGLQRTNLIWQICMSLGYSVLVIVCELFHKERHFAIPL